MAPAAPAGAWFRTHWLTYASVALIAVLLLGVVLLARNRLFANPAQGEPTAGIATLVAAEPSAVLPILTSIPPETGAPGDSGETGPTTTPPLPTLAPLATAAVMPTAVPQQATAAPAVATALPAGPIEQPGTPPTGEDLQPGGIVTSGDWRISVLQPAHLLLLNGSIAGMAPGGRFALALVAVSNQGGGPARLPESLLAVVDSQGNRYAPMPAASTAYLSAYERGVRGDLSMEEDVQPGAGFVSMPVLFDVPPSAAGLVLVVENASSGWRFPQ